MPELEISRIHDAYDRGGECPVCDVMTQAENAYVHSFHGGRVMSPEVRVRTNRTGFCPEHLERLYRGEGKLGLALMVHTHLKETVPLLKGRLEEAAAATSPPARGRRAPGALAATAGDLEAAVASCYICDMLVGDLDRYCYTVLYLWQRDATFPRRLGESRGFCLPHYAALLRKAERMLSAPERERWMALTTPIMAAALERLETEVEVFTQRYHHASGPTEAEERSALSRAIQKLTGRALRLEGGLGPALDHDQDALTTR